MQIGFKIDVETKRGLEKGIPNLLEIFKDCGIPASFFIPMGPDKTGCTVRRIFTKPQILRKATRTNIFRIYGFPTLFYGTLLPSPGITDGNEGFIRKIEAEGHEVGIHGYDHFKWQDFVNSMDEEEIRCEFEKAFSVFGKIFKSEPRGFATPGWQCNEKAYRVIEEKHFLYTSNTRGKSVYFPEFGGLESRTPEIPTTLPTLDELRIPLKGAIIDKTLDIYLGGLNGTGLNIYTLHAEIEGMICRDFLKRFIEKLKIRKVQFVRLREIAEEALSRKEMPPKSRIVNGTLRGRSGFVACQAVSD